jgi:hypothetical protein
MAIIGCQALGFGEDENPAAGPPSKSETAPVRTYGVGKKVTGFPTTEDFSTPEAAYATMHRVWAAEGDGAWARLCVRELAGRVPALPKKPLPAQRAERLLNAEIVEVSLYRETNAAVFARMNLGGKEGIDMRSLRREEGRWLNHGNDVAGTLEEARKRFARRCAYVEAKEKLASRPAVANPQEHVRPFVEFLQREAAEPQEFLLHALAKHRVVILGEVHHRPRYWDFNARLVRSPEFGRRAGVIYLELPRNNQSLVDQFLAAPKHDPQPVIETLRDMLWMGWPDQPMLDFFKAVWEANHALPKAQRVRIVLVDMARPWQQIQQRKDWAKYEVDRDQFMAENILRDLGEHAAEPRQALFMVGYGHAMVDLARPGGEPMKTAGWHLREALGATNVFAIFPHSPVISNNGQVGGRLALGLFETAFAALTNRPMAFPLDRGPFGGLVFDASLDELTADPFRKGYQAYLYLGPLEEEVFSPLIPGFYTEEFVKELDRRSRVMNGRGLVQAEGVKTADAKGFIEWMGQSWGQPRREWSARQLGPLNAWEWGSDWETKRKPAGEPTEAQSLEAPQPGATAAKTRLINLVEDFFRHNYRDLTSRETLEWGEATPSGEGAASIRYKYRAQVWGRTTITNHQVFRFDRQGRFLSVKNEP